MSELNQERAKLLSIAKHHDHEAEWASDVDDENCMLISTERSGVDALIASPPGC